MIGMVRLTPLLVVVAAYVSISAFPTCAFWSGAPIDIVEINFPSDDAHVGSARRLAMDRAYEIGGPDCVLLTTDADAAPAPNWVDANLQAIESGADIVGGHIVGYAAEEVLLGPGFVRRAARHLHYARLMDRLASLIDPVPHDPWPRHSDHTGASLAVRAAVYDAIGGMPRVPCREDIAFVRKACRAGYRLRHPLDVKVVVSARLVGRAANGMADCLKTWVAAERQGAPHLVEDPTSVTECLRQQRILRARNVAFARMHPDRHQTTPIVFSAGHINDLQTPLLDKGKSETRIDVEVAIKQLEQMIADTESQNGVA